jgi:type IV pilus assembly protein PilE
MIRASFKGSTTLRERTMGKQGGKQDGKHDGKLHATQGGFTLLELLIVVAVIGILGMIALPSYSDYVKRGKIAEAASQLGQWRGKMEHYFLDNRSFLDAGGNCGVPAPTGADVKHFTYTCPVKSANTYTLQATGNAASGMSGFTYTIDHQNAKQTTAAPAGWAAATMPTNCWITKKGGVC